MPHIIIQNYVFANSTYKIKTTNKKNYSPSFNALIHAQAHIQLCTRHKSACMRFACAHVFGFCARKKHIMPQQSVFRVMYVMFASVLVRSSSSSKPV